MTRGRGETRARLVIALALTWDGARWPTRSLPPKARAFLSGGKKPSTPAPSPADVAKLLEQDQVAEVRICWVPCLRGGANVLAEPFASPDGFRLRFDSAKVTLFGDVLGVVYLRRRGNLGGAC